jgi:ATP-dependent RNA helicase SrmB
VLGLIPAKPRTLLLSATLGEYRVASFASQVLEEPLQVQVGQNRSLPPHIRQLAYFADSLEHKFQLLGSLLSDAAQELTLVFGFGRERCQRIQSWLQSQGLASQSLHGDLIQKDRNRITYRFMQGEIPILVATDLAARGLHLPSVTRVIHFDLPRSVEIYLHRSGRTGRNGQPGETLLLVEAHDAQLLGRIERYQKLRIKRVTRPGLEPKHREPVFSRKKKPKTAEKPEAKPRVKQRWRNTKNKGKPKPK